MPVVLSGMRRREFHPEASLDIDEVWAHIAKDSVDAADRVIAEIDSTIGKVSDFPEIGHRRPDLTSRPLRFLRCYNYLIAYLYDEERILVIAVLHGHRNPETLAALLHDRQR